MACIRKWCDLWRNSNSLEYKQQNKKKLLENKYIQFVFFCVLHCSCARNPFARQCCRAGEKRFSLDFKFKRANAFRPLQSRVQNKWTFYFNLNDLNNPIIDFFPLLTLFYISKSINSIDGMVKFGEFSPTGGATSNWIRNTKYMANAERICIQKKAKKRIKFINRKTECYFTPLTEPNRFQSKLNNPHENDMSRIVTWSDSVDSWSKRI